MKKIFFSVYFLIFSFTCFSQWSPLNSGTTERLNSVCFTNFDNGYIVGNNGLIIKTVDAGLNWVPQISGTNNQLNSVFFINSTIGFSVGDSGTIIKTKTAGNVWFEITSGTALNLNSVYFITDSMGFIVGGKQNSPYPSTDGIILKTIDAGDTWTIDTLLPVCLLSVYFIDSDTGIAVGKRFWGDGLCGSILKTTNSGVNWEIKSFYNDYSLNSVCFSNSNSACVVGKWGNIYKTIDVGVNWTLAANTGYTMNSLFFLDNNKGYSVGAEGKILRTLDDGFNWSTQTTNITTNLNSIYFTDSINGFVVGDDGVVLKTLNGGEISIEENMLPDYSIIMNPYLDNIKIENFGFPNEIVISIFDIQAKAIIENSYKNQNQIQLDVSKFSRGIYIVKFQSESFVATKKLVIQ